MNRLTEDELAELDLEFYLDQEGVPFKVGRGVSGVQLNIQTCPFQDCADDRHRTYFGVETGKGNCFVCGRGFSALSYIHNHQGNENWRHTFEMAKELLRDQGWRPKREAMTKVEIGEIKLPLNTPIPGEDGAVLDYLAQRGFDADICRYFDLRHCQQGWWMFKDENNHTQMQNFSNRVIIPVTDLDGTLKTFQGRDLTGTSERKYLFPKELPGTGRYLFNAHNCQATTRACMGEGAFDVAAIKMALDGDVSLRDVVPIGSFGKHLSYGDRQGNDQLGRFYWLKQRGLQEVTIMWDGEVNALNAALKAAPLIVSAGIKVRIALLPHTRDPNEVPPEIVRKAFYGAVEFSPKLAILWGLQNPYSNQALRKRHGV